MPRGGHGSTYAGNPLVCAAGAATVRILADPQLHLRVEELGTRVIERLRSVDSPLVRDVRGRGLMIGIELRRPAGPVVRELQERGVLVLPAGRTVLRILPPLIIGSGDADAAVDRIVEVLRRPREHR
jgi:acetylornithine/succinyldiaminopimelate/putrescine aminotransferase